MTTGNILIANDIVNLSKKFCGQTFSRFWKHLQNPQFLSCSNMYQSQQCELDNHILHVYSNIHAHTHIHTQIVNLQRHLLYIIPIVSSQSMTVCTYNVVISSDYGLTLICNTITLYINSPLNIE